MSFQLPRMPIAWAPRDRDLVLLWTGNNKPVIGWWSMSLSLWAPDHLCWNNGSAAFGHPVSSYQLPTQWLPLPPPQDALRSVAGGRDPVSAPPSAPPGADETPRRRK